MKHFKYTLAILSIGMAFNSCKKNFLEVENNTNPNRQTYVKDLSTMQEFLNGIYIVFTRDLEHGHAAAYPELIADNMRPPLITSTYMIPHYSWTQQADEADIQIVVGIDLAAKAMNPLWKTGYHVIRSCSFVIEDADKYRGENPAKADNMKGQAYALRALLHFKLVNAFAQAYMFTNDASHPGVPYITTPDITKAFSRQMVSEVYDNIIADFKKAIELLPAEITDTRFISRPAAKAFLARVYLFKEDYVAAKALAVEISNQYPLLKIADGYPNDLFRLKSVSKTESLFQLSPRSSGYTTNFMGRYLISGSSLRFTATSDIATMLRENAGDVRKAWVTSTSGQWYVTKFPANAAPEVTPAVTPAEIAYYPALIRSSEMFLTVAEASAKTGDENNARSYLDAVRKRANPTANPVTATGQALLDSIYKERRKELAFESLRMWDLQRWKMGVNRTDALFPAAKILPYPSNKTIAPIPPLDVQLAGISQNPSY